MEKRIFSLINAEKLPPEQLAAGIFGDTRIIDGTTKQFKEAHPAEYRAAQQVERTKGRLGVTLTEQLQDVRKGWNEQAKPRDRSVEEYLACNKWSQAEAEAPLPEDLDAVSYAQRELARSSYGLIFWRCF